MTLYSFSPFHPLYFLVHDYKKFLFIHFRSVHRCFLKEQHWIVKIFITCIIRTSGSLKLLFGTNSLLLAISKLALKNIFLRLLAYICCFMGFRIQDDSNSFFLQYQNFIHISFNLPVNYHTRRGVRANIYFKVCKLQLKEI